MNKLKVIEELVTTAPQLLKGNTDDPEGIALKFLPFSIGIEIECVTTDSFSITQLLKFEHLLAATGGMGEIRFRIPKGLEGLLVLEKVCEYLTTTCELTDSGIHYHIDCTGWIQHLTQDEITKNADWVLKELDTWEYPGHYNGRRFASSKGGWIGKRENYQTLEIRIGEMSFDYRVIIKRIIHACKIVKKLKYLVTKDVDTSALKAHVERNKALVEAYEKRNKVTVATSDEVKEVISKRIVKFN